MAAARPSAIDSFWFCWEGFKSSLAHPLFAGIPPQMALIDTTSQFVDTDSVGHPFHCASLLSSKVQCHEPVAANTLRYWTSFVDVICYSFSLLA